MPIWLRKFTHKKLLEHYKKENETPNVLTNNKPEALIHKPAIPATATYSTKSSK